MPVPLKVFVAGAINDVLDAHHVRAETLGNPVSDVVSLMLFGSAVTALFLLGNRAGLVGRALTWRTFVFSGFLLIVMSTILDTQRAYEGFIRTDDVALRATIFEMRAALKDR